MRRIFSLLVSVLLCAALSAQAYASFNPETNYMELMIAAACRNEPEAGETASEARREKINDMGLDLVQVEYNDLWLMSKVIYIEAGSIWLSDEWKMCVGEVVLNRVASEEFPNTIEEVLSQPGQYYGKNSSYFKRVKPSEHCVNLALLLLEGVRVMDEPSVVFQANYPLGSGTFKKLSDSQLGDTYLCYSSNMHLYEG